MKENPYNRLKRIGGEFFLNKVKYRHKVEMWYYPKNRLDEGWNLGDLYERVSAAKQLGYDVILEADNKGLIVKYVKSIPDIPWEFR